MRNDAQIDNNFKYHSVSPEQQKACAEIREKLREVAHFIDHTMPSSRERSLALTKLEEAMFWANAGIARYE